MFLKILQVKGITNDSCIKRGKTMSNNGYAHTISHIMFAFLLLLLGTGTALAQQKVMFLGDSITRGVSGATDSSGYRNDFSDLVNNEGVVVDFVGSLADGTGFDNQHEGHDGFRADQILANLNTYLGANPDIIILHIGTNDVSNDQTPESTRDEIGSILNTINTFNPAIKVILSSLVPRTDTKDPQTASLNALIQDLFFKKRDDQGHNLYYAGVNEIFKTNPNWAIDYMDNSVHPNDAGYNIMAQVLFDAFMVAFTQTNTLITDNFQRTNLGITWDADTEFILNNGDLVNTATMGSGNWEYMATYRGIKNPSSARIKWSATAQATGKEAGIALLLDGPTQNASGFLAWITESDNMIRLWTIVNGATGVDLNLEQASQASAPGPGDIFRVDVTVDPSNLQFDYYVNDVFAGNITMANSGVSGELYSGFIARHARANDIDDFTLLKTSDTTPPDPILTLSAGSPSATSVPLTWLATGDDGSTGQASSYDLRYSTALIDNSNFAAATQVTGLAPPAPQGSVESVVVSGLNPGTQYFLAVKAIDDAGNTSIISNVIVTSTLAGNFFVDNFSRTTLGPDWTTAADYAIVNNALSNTSTNTPWNEIAVLNARKNPEEVSFTWSATASDAGGIDQGGFILVFGSPVATGSGYAITRRTADNTLRLWELTSGTVANLIEKNSIPALSPPQPGDVVKIRIFSDGSANKFDFFINDVFDGQVSDPSFLHDLATDNWAGVTLRANDGAGGALINDIDDFTMLLKIGAPANLLKVAGDAQVDTVGQQLPIPLTVKVTDASGSPIQGVNVNYQIIAGAGSLDVAPPKADIVIEAEAGVLSSPMIVGNDAGASQGSFVYVPASGPNLGLAEYTVNIEQAGDYIMWGRGIYPDADQDAFFVIVGNDTSLWDMGQRNFQTDWHWDEISHRGTGSATNPQLDPVVFSFGAGLNTIKFREGKVGAKLDQFVLTKVGSGFQPPADQSAVQPGGAFTDGQGTAIANLTLGPTPGMTTVQASVTGLPLVNFTATATAGAVDSIVIVSGDGQIGTLGQPLANPFVVKLFDAFGNLAIGSQTSWIILPPGNGSLSAGTTVIADAGGQASNILTLATNTGLNQVQVTAPGYTGPNIIFTATPQAGAATKIALQSGDNQTGTAGMALPNPFEVLVTDALDIPVANQNVTFTVISGGGSLGGASQTTVVTNAAGAAATILTLGPTPEGANQVQATSAGLQGSPVTFSANAAAPQSLEAISSLTQSGVANLPLADSIEVRVRDALGQPLPFFPVTFQVLLGGGQVNSKAGPEQIETDMAGIAKVEWRLGGTAGTNNNKLSASATWNSQALSGSPIEFTASAVVGAAENLAIVSGTNQIGTILQSLTNPFVVRVTDVNGNPIAAWPVTFTVAAGGGNFGGQSILMVPTDSNGQAQATLTLGNTVGNDNNRVDVSSPQTNSVSFMASANSSGATTLTLVSGGGQTGQAGLALAQTVRVRVTDNIPNNIVGHQVFFSVLPGSGGATINGTVVGDTAKTILTDENGIAEVTWYLGGTLGQNGQNLEILANDGLNNLIGSPLPISATAVAGPVDPDVSTVISDRSALQANGQDRANITVTVVDKFGNPAPGTAITILSNSVNDIIIQPQEPTDSNGQAFGTIASVVAGQRTVTAKIIGGIQLNSSASVNFLAEPPDQVEVSTGNGQTSNVGTALDEPIEVLVTDNFSNPVQGVTVEFAVSDGGGFIVQPNTTVTDVNGLARATWVLGANAGMNSAEARAFFNEGLINGSPVLFQATGINAIPTTMTLQTGANQEGVWAGRSAPEPLGVLVTDLNGDPVSGVTVNFSVTLGGGTLSEVSPKTDYEGIASSRYTMGPVVGTNIVQASSANLDGSPITFEFVSVVGQAAKLIRVAGNDAQVEVNTLHAISVKITDINDNPNDGAAVNFEVIDGGATIQSQDGVTDADGIGTAQVLMPNAVGEVRLKATSVDLPGFFLNFIIHAIAGNPVAIAEFDGNNQEGTIGRPLVHSLQVRITDAFDNPVAGFSVPWVVTLGGGSLATGNSISDEAGIASNDLTLGPATGANEARAVTTLTPSQIVFAANGVNNAFPEFMNLASQTVTEGDLLEFQVEATDADSDPITYSAANLPSGSTFTPGNRTFSWIPSDTQHGEYNVTFTAQDNRGGLDAETITITVVNSNNPPVITAFSPTDDEFQQMVGQVINFSVSVNDLDPNDTITYTWLYFSSANPGGEFFSASPNAVFDTNNFIKGTYTFQVEVSDGKDQVMHVWTLHLVTSVELATFNAQFFGFDGVRISWATSREVDNTGFNILRSLSRDGTFIKINDGLVPPNNKGQYQFSDNGVKVGTRYFYILQDVDLNGRITEHGPLSIDIVAPNTFELSQNFPNPFNPETKIQYQLPEGGNVVIRIFDVLGREVRTLVDDRRDAGFHVATWDARNNRGLQVGSGIYYYQIVSGKNRETKKMLLLK